MKVIKEGSYTYAKSQIKQNRYKAFYCLLLSVLLTIYSIFIYSGLIFGALPFLFSSLYYFNKISNWNKGIEGEEKVSDTLQKLDDSYYLLNDVVLYPGEGNIDHIVLGPGGLFALETKNFSGRLSCHQDMWYYRSYGGKRPIPSISQQAKRNAVELKKFIEQHDSEKRLKDRSLWIEGVIAFTDPSIELELQNPSIPIVRLKELCQYIKSRSPIKPLSHNELEWIGNIIAKHCQKELVNGGQKVKGILKWLIASLPVLAVISGAFLWVLAGGDPKGDWVRVTGIIDGDTIQVGRGWRKAKVQLIGVDTPGMGHTEKASRYWGHKAAEFTKKMLSDNKVHLEFEKVDRDAYGRLLAYVYLEDGTLFNAELIKKGYGQVYSRFPFKYLKKFTSYEKKAREQGLGQWNRNIAPLLSGKIIGNKKSKIYHMPGQALYHIDEANRIYFDSEEEAIKAGYRKSQR